MLPIASYRNPQPVQTRLCLRRIMSTEMCVGMRVCLYTYRCPCVKTRCEPNTIPSPPSLPPSPPPSSLSPPLSVSLTSEHAARGQTCISPHSPLASSLFFMPSSFLLSPRSFCFSTFFCSGREGGPKHEKRQERECVRVCVEAHMVAVPLARLLFSRWC